MATLPIATSEIITPLALNEDEEAVVLDSANHSTSVVRSGGNRWSLSLSIAPINIVQSPTDYTSLDVFLKQNPTFEVPLINIAVNTLATTVTVDAIAAVGDFDVDIVLGGAGLGAPVVGQYVQFSNNTKCYQVASYAVTDSTHGTITLTKALRVGLTTSHTMAYSATDGKSNAFSGVLCSFVNRDFGFPLHRIEGGVLASFGPLDLIEQIS